MCITLICDKYKKKILELYFKRKIKFQFMIPLTSLVFVMNKKFILNCNIKIQDQFYSTCLLDLHRFKSYNIYFYLAS